MHSLCVGGDTVATAKSGDLALSLARKNTDQNVDDARARYLARKSAGVSGVAKRRR